MRVHELIEALRRDVAVTGSAGSQVMLKNGDTGEVLDIELTLRDVHDDADGSITHWIIGKPF